MSAAAALDPVLLNSDVAISFLRDMHPHDLWVLTAIDPEKKVGIETRTFGPDKEEAARAWVEQHGKTNLYWGVNPPLRALQKKASREDIKEVSFLHVDIDPRVGEPLQLEQNRIRALLGDNLPPGVPRPTVVVFSGGGFQAYWKLAAPIQINGDKALAEDAARYNQKLELLFGADSCHSIEHLMRLAGSVNTPDDKKLKKGRVRALAHIVEADWSRVYPITDFTPVPKQAAKQAGPGVNIGGPAKRIADLSELDKWQVPIRVKAIIVQGHDVDTPKPGDNSRSVWLFDVTCNLVRYGVPDDVIFAIITDRDFGISASVLDKGSKANSYAAQQIKRAKEASTQTNNAKWSGDPTVIALGEMNELHAVIENYGNKTRVMTERPSPFFQGFDDFRNIYMNKKISAGTDEDGKPITMPRGKWWLGHALRRQYKRVEFMPGQESPEGVFNLWRGFPVAPRPGTCDLFLALLRDTICAGCDTYSEWLLDWMAHAVQHPQEPGEVAVVLRGGQGIGKSFLAEHFGELFGRHFVPLTDPKHVVGNFNQILHDALFVFADEAFAANDKRAEGVLKGLVTQSHITIEPKGVDAFKARRLFRMLLASNNSWVVPADVDDRRFLVLDVATAHKYDTFYFAGIDDEWKRGGREALMHVLLNRDITRFDHRRRPNTPALMDQKLHTLRGASRVIYEMLASGDAPAAKVDGGRIFIATRDLHRDIGIKCSETALGRALAAIAEHQTAIREQCEGHRKKGFWLPGLSDARRRWADLSKLEGVRWPSDDGEWTASPAEISASGEEPPF